MKPNTRVDLRVNTPIDFAKRLFPGENGCVLWMGSRGRKGYGQFTWTKGFPGVVHKKQWIAHRWIWNFLRGPIPDGMHVLHKCDNPPCVNIEHLRLGTNQENVDDKMAKRRHHRLHVTHCPKGHEFTPENTRVRKSDNTRCCRTCDRANCAKAWKTGKWTKPPPEVCCRGHKMTEANTRIAKNGRWNCRTCQAENSQRSRERRGRVVDR